VIGSGAPASLVVIGGSTVWRTPDGHWATKRPVAQYLHDLAREFGGCTWLCGTNREPRFTGGIDPSLIQVVPLADGPRSWPSQWRAGVVHVPRGSIVLGYLPALVPLLPVMPLIRARASRLIVYLAGDYEMQIETYLRQGRGVRARLYRLGFEYPMRAADTVIARGRHLAGLAARHNHKVVETVPMGHMDLSTQPTATLAPDSATLVYVGKLQRSKGVEFLLRAMANLRERSLEHELRLRVVGDGVDRERLEMHARRLGLADCVEFMGWVEEPIELASLIWTSAAIVVPSSDHPEGVPRVIDEAIALGTPVVATTAGGVGAEFPNDEVILVKPGSVSSLEEGLLRIIGSGRPDGGALAAARRSRWGDYASTAAQHAAIIRGGGL
jgi:glycosyltransferase involved in cell wall biosynthesis